VDIHFDAAVAQITTNFTAQELQVPIICAKRLTYTDKKISFSNRNKPAFLRRSDKVCLYDHTNKTFPTGLLPKVCRALINSGFTVNLKNRIEPVSPTEWALPDWAYEHQCEIVRVGVEQQRGIIKSPTGSGKSKAIAFLIMQYPDAQILVTVPSKQLLHQTAKEIEGVIGEKVGRIGDDLQDWQRVTVGIINSLSNLSSNADLFSSIQVLLVDECHKAASEYYVRVGNACRNTDVRLGFSATPWRENGDDLVMEGVLGPIILEISEKVLQENKLIMPVEYWAIEVPDPEFVYAGAVREISRTGKVQYSYDHLPDGKPDRNEVVERALLYYDKRNELIVQVAEAFLKSDYPYPAVVLVERISHGKHIQRLLKDKGYEIEFISGDTKTKERKQALDDLGKKSRLIIASSILKEGVDVPQLGVGIIAGGGSASSKIIQQIGRICRRFEEKKKAIIIDLEDLEKFYLRFASTARIETVEKIYPGSVKSLSSINAIDKIFACDENKREAS